MATDVPTWEDTTDAPTWDDTWEQDGPPSVRSILESPAQPLPPEAAVAMQSLPEGAPWMAGRDPEEGLGAALWNQANDPLATIERKQGQSTMGKIGAGAYNVGAGLVEGLTSPLGAASLALGGAPSAVQKLAALGFGGMMTKGAAEKLGEASVTGDVQAYTEGALMGLPVPFLSGVAPIPFVKSPPRRLGADIALTKGDALRVGVRDLAEQVENTPLPETAPASQRRLGVKVPPNQFFNPGMTELVDRVIQERQGQGIRIPGEEPALQTLRREFNPPRFEAGISAPKSEPLGGQISFAASAESRAVPNARQVRVGEIPVEQLPVEIPQGVTGPDAASYRRPTPPPTPEQYNARQRRAAVEQGLTIPEIPMEPLVPDVMQFPPPVGMPAGTFSKLQRSRIQAGQLNVRSNVSNNPPKARKETVPERPDITEFDRQIADKVFAKEYPAEITHSGIESGAIRGTDPAMGAIINDLRKASTPAEQLKIINEYANSRDSWLKQTQERRNNLTKENTQSYVNDSNKAQLFREAIENVADFGGREFPPEVVAEAVRLRKSSVEPVIPKDVPLNPGGALKDLPPELQAKSNSVQDAMRAEFEALKAKQEPVVEGVTALDPASSAPLSATDALINKLEALRFDKDIPQQFFSLPHPEIFKSYGKAVWNTGVDAAIVAVKAGRKIAEAVEVAWKAMQDYAKERGIKLDETQVKANLENILSEETAPASPRPTQPATPHRGAAADLTDIYKIFEPAKKPSVGVGQRVSNVIEAVRTGVSSKFRPVDKLAEDIAKAYGTPNKKGIAAVMEQLKGSQGKGEADVYRFDRAVSDLVKGSEKDFNAYVFLRRGIDRLTQDIATGETRRKISNYTAPELQAKLQTLEQKLGPEKLRDFQQAAERYQQQMDNALRLQVDSGRMSPELYQAIKDGNQFYAPFKVMKYLEETSRPSGTGARIDTAADYTKAMEGIESPDFKLGDMLGAARQNLLISRILADKNNAMRKVADLAAFDVGGQFIRKLGEKESVPHGLESVNVFEGGQQNRYAVDPAVAEALQIYGANAQNLITRMLAKGSVPFRAGATSMNVAFLVSNLMADVPRQALVSKYGIRGVTDLVRYPLDFVESMYSSIVGDVLGLENKLFLDFLDSGAAGTTIQEHLTPNALRFTEPSNISKSKKLAKTVIDTIPNFATAIEQTSKIMGVKRAMRFEGVESGAQLAKQIPEAITEIRRFSGSPDFGRQGKWVEQARLNLLYMFLNARIQGAVADLGRLTGRDGAKRAGTTWMRLGTAVGVPSTLVYLLNNSEEYAADYAKRPEQEKNNYWLIPKDSFITSESGEKMRDYWRIPKRESSKWMANMVESGLRFAEERDPEQLGKWAQTMMEDISPVNIQGNTAQERMESVGASLNPLIKAPLEVATGRDMYRHRPIVPESQRKASSELQYTPYTSEAFKSLATAMPDMAPEVFRSPLMIENMTKNLSAGLITQFLPRRPVQGREGVENVSLLSRFQALPYTDQTQFREQIQQLERQAADEQLTRHRGVVELINKNKGKSLWKIAKDAPKDELFRRHLTDVYLSERNGVTPQERPLLALPVKQRAAYVATQLNGKTPEQKRELIRDLAKKRILTEAVAGEVAQLLTK